MNINTTESTFDKPSEVIKQIEKLNDQEKTTGVQDLINDALEQ